MMHTVGMPAPRFHVMHPLQLGEQALPSAVARHLRVLRLDAGDAVSLFDGRGGEWQASVTTVRRDEVIVEVTGHHPVERELSLDVHLALSAPTNDRMDTLVEKATELGATSIQPLLTERSVLRLSGERAVKKSAHWQAVAVAACEQCGRNRVPTIHATTSLASWLESLPAMTVNERRLVLSTVHANHAAPTMLVGSSVERTHPTSNPATIVCVRVLSGPEGGLSNAEEAWAVRSGFEATGLGPRILRADTAPLAMLVLLGATR